MSTLTPLQKDEAAIRLLLNEVVNAFNEGDLEKLLSLHSDDLILMEPNMPVIHGKQPVRKMFNEFQKKGFQIQLAFDILELEVHHTLAFARGRVFKTVLQHKIKGKEESCKFICLLKKQEDGVWLRTHVIVNSDEPAKTAAGIEIKLVGSNAAYN